MIKKIKKNYIIITCLIIFGVILILGGVTIKNYIVKNKLLSDSKNVSVDTRIASKHCTDDGLCIENLFVAESNGEYMITGEITNINEHSLSDLSISIDFITEKKTLTFTFPNIYLNAKESSVINISDIDDVEILKILDYKIRKATEEDIIEYEKTHNPNN